MQSYKFNAIDIYTEKKNSNKINFIEIKLKYVRKCLFKNYHNPTLTKKKTETKYLLNLKSVMQKKISKFCLWFSFPAEILN